MTDDTYVCAIDQGTTGTRCMLFDHDGVVAASAYETHEQHYPRPGRVEHDPVEIWTRTAEVVGRALEDADIDGDRLAALGVTNQRETTVLWDAETREPVHNAIVWQDRRTTGRVEELEADGKGEMVRRTTGLTPDAYFSATKLEWLLDHGGDDDLRERAAAGRLRFGTVDTWLIDRLTNAHVTDVTNASRTMLYDIHVGDWAPGLLEEFGVPEAVLPTVKPSSSAEPYGYTDPDGPFGAAVPVTAALGDQQAALFGQGCVEPGESKNTYGTGSFLLMHTGEDAVMSDHGSLTTIAFQQTDGPIQYALEGSIFATGAAIEWLDDVGLIGDPAETEPLVRSVESTGGVYFVPAFTGLGAPHWDQRARGTIIGLTRGTERAHLARATLEAIAFQTRDVLEAMEADSGIRTRSLRVDGGAVKNDALCRLQADVIDRRVVRPTVDETTALGAAFAAGLAVGYWGSLETIREHRRIDRTFEPAVDRAVMDRRYERWHEAVERASGWARE